MSKSLAVQIDASPTSPAAVQLGDLGLMSADEYAAKEKKLVRKLDLRLMPVLFVIIILK
jgi:hypothetical protein